MNEQQRVAALMPNNSKILGLYFSADYCRWCRDFTPLLISMYKHLQVCGIEIIFVASDKTEEAFDAYRADHPWPAISYTDQLRLDLRVAYDIKTIPALLFFDRSGVLVEKDGRNLVVEHLNPTEELCAASIATHLELHSHSKGFEYDSDDCDF